MKRCNDPLRDDLLGTAWLIAWSLCAITAVIGPGACFASLYDPVPENRGSPWHFLAVLTFAFLTVALWPRRFPGGPQQGVQMSTLLENAKDAADKLFSDKSVTPERPGPAWKT